MDVLGHIIQDSEIIGISPLYVQSSKDLDMVQIYGERKLIFEIHCPNRSIAIDSGMFRPGTEGNIEHLQLGRYNEYKEKYAVVRKQVEDLIKWRNDAPIR